MARVLAWGVLVASIVLVRAHAGTAPLPGESGRVNLGAWVEVLEDPTRALTIEDVRRQENLERFRPSGAETPNFGYTRSAWWLRFCIAGGSHPGGDMLLEVSFPSIDRLELYAPPGGGPALQRAGDSRPWDERAIKHRNHVFRLTVPKIPGTHDYFLRAESAGVMTLPLTFWLPAAFERHNYHVQLLLGLFYGLVAAMVLYNLLLSASVRDRSYAYYVCYATAFTVFFLAFDGLAFQYLWPESVWWANRGLATSLALTLCFGCLFAVQFLDMARTAPRANRALGAIAAAGAVLAFSAATGWLIEYGYILRTISVLGLAGAAIALAVSVRALFGGFLPARFFLLAWGALLVFIALGALRNFALAPTSFITLYGLHIGFGLDVLLLSFALADRINALKRTAAAAQAEALAKHGALLEATRESGRELARRVEERTRELNLANERLREDAREREQLMAQLREQEQHLRFMAQHDPLTGLPNRASMQQRLALALELAKRNRKKVAVMLVDLDDFKRVNDSRGHLAGDQALAAVAGRLRASVRASDTVARYGGDEFVVLAGEIDRAEDAAHIAEKIVDSVGVPLAVDGGTERVSCSIGISVFPDDAREGERLIELADRAMYAAKAARSRRYAFHGAEG